MPRRWSRGDAAPGQAGLLYVRRLASRDGSGERQRGRVTLAQDDGRGTEHELGIVEVGVLGHAVFWQRREQKKSPAGAGVNGTTRTLRRRTSRKRSAAKPPSPVS